MKNIFKVGQILYTTNNEKMSIIPVQVVEKIEKSTLEGKETQFIISFPDHGQTKIQLNKIKTQIFLGRDEVKDFMINNATNAIENMLELSDRLIKEKFIKEYIAPVDPVEQNVQVEAPNDIITVDLGNGVKAKMNTKNLNQAIDK